MPNDSVRVAADTYWTYGVESLDFGHGCARNMQVSASRHGGISIRGKGCDMNGVRSHKAAAQGGGTDALVLHGSEIYEGLFSIDSSDLFSLANPLVGACSPAPIDIVLQAAGTGACVFVLNSNYYKFASGTTYPLRIQIDGTVYGPSLFVNGGVVLEGPDLTQFARLQRLSGAATMPTAVILDLEGMPVAADDWIVNAGTGLTITRKVARLAS